MGEIRSVSKESALSTVRPASPFPHDQRASPSPCEGLQRDLEKLWTDHNRASDGTTRVQSEYLEVIAVVK
jgi:hypothetical protein